MTVRPDQVGDIFNRSANGAGAAPPPEPSPFITADQAIEMYRASVKQPAHRIPTGFPALDAVLRGLARGEVLAVVALTGNCKTMMQENLVPSMTKDSPGLFFSLEMETPELLERAASRVSGWSGNEIEQSTRDDDPRVEAVFEDVRRSWKNIRMVQEPCSLERIEELIVLANAERVAAGTPLVRLVFIDYFGQIDMPDHGSIYEQTSKTAREMKRMAKRQKVSVVMAAQLNKEGATGGEPVTLRMVRDSGCITEAADNIVGMWRPSLAATDPRDRKALKNLLRVKVIKGRTSKANSRPVDLYVDFAAMRISSLPSQPEPDSGGASSDQELPF